MLIESSFLTSIQSAQKRAEQGDAFAMSLMGNVYFDGIGTVKDEAMGIEFYKKAVLIAQELDPLSETLEEMQYPEILAFLGIRAFYEEEYFEEAEIFLRTAYDFALARYPKDVANDFIVKSEICLLLRKIEHHLKM
jgi:TPR repeat protein